MKVMMIKFSQAIVNTKINRGKIKAALEKDTVVTENQELAHNLGKIKGKSACHARLFLHLTSITI